MTTAFAVTMVAVQPKVATGPSAPVHFASNLDKACTLLQGGARCVVVKRAFPVLDRIKNRFCSLPPGYEEDFDLSPNLAGWELDEEVVHVLKTFDEVHKKAQFKAAGRGRVARVTGTPCPLAHFDLLTLRAMATLRGPGVVLLGSKDENHVVYRSEQGDAVFMAGNNDYDNVIEPVWHRSPRRMQWMPDRVVTQVDVGT